MPTATVAPIPEREKQTRLTAAQRKILRAGLTARLQAQRSRASLATAAIDDFAGTYSPLDREFARETVAGLLAGARQLEDALERLELNRYGICVACARTIPFERIEAIPEVAHCVDCIRTRLIDIAPHADKRGSKR